jgi:hypothetical protein
LKTSLEGRARCGQLPFGFRVRKSVEAVEKLLKNPFSAEIGEHCQIAEFLSY